MAALQRPSGIRPREFHGIYTVAPQMEEVFVRLRRAARGDWTVLLTGETGTGKELAAAALHAESPRARGPFRAINCATLSPTLLESQLFGHVRGAFTGAIRDHGGLFRAAHGGSVFLDEVTEIPLELQGRLLRVLQEKTFIPVGATLPVPVDTRVVSATNRSLHAEVEAKRFREDLSYRLRVVPVALPPLRQRSGDIVALFWHFVDELNGLGFRRIDGVSRAAFERLRRYPWPGNVRELRSAVEFAYAVGDGPVFGLDDLTPEVRGDIVPHAAQRLRSPEGNDERDRIAAALRSTDGRIGRAALALGISRQTLWRKLYALGLR
jgi:two-component system, NtrC family, response regulator AtoC